VLFCDDLSFEADDPSYKALKAVLDGSVSQAPNNVLIYATSNRRHLLPEYMSENRDSRLVEGELHHGEAVEEKISLSERFGLWLSFHPFPQDTYLKIAEYWLEQLGVPAPLDESTRDRALRFALMRGSRSGRVAWQFARDEAGRRALPEI
jgi:predicted AAA+ superfamily ATPase